MRRLRQHDEGVSVVIGAILIVGILVIAAITVQVQYVPIWDKRREYDHALLIQSQMAALRAEMDRQVVNPSALVVSNPLSMAGTSTSGLGMTKLADRVAFTPGGQAFTISSTRLTIQTNNGQLTAGANENWDPVQVTGDIVNDVAAVASFRLRLNHANGQDNDTQSQPLQNLTITLTDATGAFAGDFRIQVDDLNGNDWDLNHRVRNAQGEIIYDNPEKFHNAETIGPWWIDLLETKYQFDAVLAAAQTPVTITLNKYGLGGDFAITYTQFTGGAVIGGGGQVVPNYSRSLGGGQLRYVANNVRWPAQTYILENGGLIIQQPDGAAFKIPPSINASAFTRPTATLFLNLPSGTVAGDLLLAHIVARGGTGQSITPPSGWTLLRRDNNGASLAAAVYYRFATSSEPTGYLFTMGQNLKAAGGLLALPGIDTSTPIEAHSGQSNAASTSVEAPSVTTTGATRVVVNLFGTATGTLFAAPGGSTERYDTAPLGTESATGSAADFIQGTAGATGTRTATAGASAVNIGQTVALRTLSTAVGGDGDRNNGASTLTLTAPSGTQNGHLMVAGLTVSGGTGTTITPPSGWTLVRRTDSGTTLSVASYYRAYGGSEPGSYTWTFSGSPKAAGGILSFRAVATSNPIQAHNGQANSASTSVTAPSVTTTETDSPLIGLFASAFGTSFTAPGGMTERYDESSTGGGGGANVAMSGATEMVAASGATGTRTATAANAAANIGQLIALKLRLGARAASAATTDTSVGTVLTISVPTLVGNAAQFSGDLAVTVQTSASQGTNFLGIGPRFNMTITTQFPGLWADFFRARLLAVPGFAEGTHFTLTTTTSQVVVSITGVSADANVDDLLINFRQAQVNIAIRG